MKFFGGAQGGSGRGSADVGGWDPKHGKKGGRRKLCDFGEAQESESPAWKKKKHRTRRMLATACTRGGQRQGFCLKPLGSQESEQNVVRKKIVSKLALTGKGGGRTRLSPNFCEKRKAWGEPSETGATTRGRTGENDTLRFVGCVGSEVSYMEA